MPGSDVERCSSTSCRGCRPARCVHVHDVFLPDAYPPEWDWRGYNEQIVIGALIQGGGFDIVWSSRYVATRLAPAAASTIAGRLPLVDGAFETSLWLRKL